MAFQSGDGHEVSTDPGRPGLTGAGMLERGRGDAERGKVLAYTCHGCHGVPNYKNAYPELQRAEARRPERPVPGQRAEGLCRRRPPAPDHAFAGRDAVRPGSRRHRGLPAGRSRAAGQAGRRHAAAGDADLRRLPWRRRREDRRSRPPDPRRPARRLHRAGAAAITRAASARTRSWPASSAAWTRRTSTRSRSSSPAAGPVQHRRDARPRQVRRATSERCSPSAPFAFIRKAAASSPRLETIGLDDLAPGEVVVKVSYSTINYKDALAATGAGKILRKYPLVGGIDLAGEVVSSQRPRVRARHRKCWSTAAACPKRTTAVTPNTRACRRDWVVPIPAGPRRVPGAWRSAPPATRRRSRSIAWSRTASSPQGGEVVVTGATGGVGSLAIDMLAGRGYKVVAVTGKKSATDYLRSSARASVLLREAIDLGTRPHGRSTLGRRDRQRRRRRCSPG